ncbi:MAG: RsmB/NOP family class I SAM-dependent RNA methyltransferase [Nibricoccus sp.]
MQTRQLREAWRLMKNEEFAATTPWSAAVKLLVRWLENNERVDALLESLPRTMVGSDRGRCQSLLFGAVRNLGRIDAHLKNFVERPPRARLKAVLLVAGFELIEGGDEHHTARVVHHAVEQAKTLASAPEARLVNAVVRKLSAALAAETVPPKLATAAQLAAYFSHPEWLVTRWLAQFGAQGTRDLLEWNQQPAPVYARWRSRERQPSPEEAEWLTASKWPGFYEVKQGHWAQVETLLADGALYLQDPSTRLAVELLAPQPGEVILDACAAPGGKSVAIADAMRSNGEIASGRVVAMDLPGARIDRLKENLGRVRGVDVALVQGDVSKANQRLFADNSLPTEYKAVLIDVPCSNTGVMRHRVDVRWRLQENDFAKHARQQFTLLSSAARRVVPGGRIVYSTCSVDTEENERLIGAFLEKAGSRFTLENSVVALPWMSGHDGAAAFLLRRKP